jgi:hypothetical protein
MKNITSRLFFTVTIVLLTAISLIAQPPPPPPPGGGGATPVGAPIYDGLFIIFALGIIYAGLLIYRIYRRQRALKEEASGA